MIENRIVKTELIKWREIKPLQPDNLKHIFNYKYIEDSILTHGFSMPFFVWQNGNDIFAVDGHSRIEVLNNLENVPEQLPATFINAKDRKEAIEILLEVFNQKSNPIANEVLTEWVEIEQISVNVQSLNVKIEDIEDKDHAENVKELTNMIACTLTDEESEIWLHIKEKLGKMKDKNAIFELIKLYSNENNID
jgi:protein-tyrosine phosphatase